MHFHIHFISKLPITVVALGIVVLVYIYSANTIITSIKSLVPSFVASKLQQNISKRISRNFNASRDFENDWCRILSARTDWISLLRTCDEQISWKRRNAINIPYLQTDTNSSFISFIDIRPAGEFSKIFIKTVTKHGVMKSIGGDSWRITINGTASINSQVFDYGNGSYEVTFLCQDEGDYNVYIYLDYSMCNGLMEPPENWFIKGSSQGKNQGVNVIGMPNDFLMSPLKSNPLRVHVGKKRIKKEKQAPLCKNCCKFLWSGLGRWRNMQWIPFYKDDTCSRNSSEKSAKRKNGNLLVYGDSVNVFFAQSLKQRHRLCRRIFKTCTFSYNWIYNIKNASIAKRQRDNLDFNVTRVISEFKQAIQSKDYNNNQSLIIFNFGLHFVESTNFSNYKSLIRNIARLITEKSRKGKAVFTGNFLWKSTTAINKERADTPQLHWRRFFTNYRIQLYNAYAADVMCNHGIPVIDAYPISASFPLGTGTHSGRSAVRNDIVHYSNEAFLAIEKFLEEHSSKYRTP